VTTPEPRPTPDRTSGGDGVATPGRDSLVDEVSLPHESDLSDGPVEPDETAPRAGAGGAREDTAARRTLHGLIEWVLVIVGALLIALVVKTFLFQAFYIPSESMEPTLIDRDRVIVNKVSYRLHDVNRGDLIVFDRPPNEPVTEIPELIKRVVGLPGETIEARDGFVYVDGRLLVEPYLSPGTTVSTFGPVPVPEGHVFVMGDNRGNSRDSRIFGPIDQDLIVGRAFVRVWPLGRLGFL
jgi:signal peptidase I